MQQWAGLLACATVIVGCHSASDVPYETIATAQQPYNPQSGSSNAYDGYLLAGDAAVKACGDKADRLNFTEATKADFRACAAPALNQLLQAADRTADVKFVPHAPFDPRTHHRGLVILTKDIGFVAEQAVKDQDWPRCADLLVASTKIACDMTGGDATDASIGYDFADKVRAQVSPYLGEMPPEVLSSLAKRLTRILEERPNLKTTVQHEGENFLLGIQTIQDSLKENKLDDLGANLYKAAQPAVDFLKRLSPKERVDYFRDFVAESKTTVDYYEKLAYQPAVKREPLEFDNRADRPWKKFSSQIFGTLDPLLELNDAFLAKSRLVAATAFALSEAKTTGAAPISFEKLGSNAVLDPYSGRPFPYWASGRDFKIYSVGPDGRDDGGTDDPESGHDLMLESTLP